MRVKTEERRQTIVETAKQLFFQQGYEATSMATIAKHVGGSKATLYNYFSSKEDVFEAVMESSTFDDVSGAFKTLSLTAPLQETLFKFGVNYLTSILTPELVSVYTMAISEARRSDVGRHFYRDGPKRGWMTFAEFLQYRANAGELKEGDFWLMSQQFKGLLEAELYMPYLLGVIDTPSKTQIELSTDRAISAFAMIYCP